MNIIGPLRKLMKKIIPPLKKRQPSPKDSSHSTSKIPYTKTLLSRPAVSDLAGPSVPGCGQPVIPVAVYIPYPAPKGGKVEK